MKIANIDIEKEIMIIAEIGNNHEGSYTLAEEMIGKAAECGVHAVKFQTFVTEHYINKNNADRFNRIKSFELTFNQFEKLCDYAKKEGVIFLSTPFDLISARFLNQIVPAFKISSSDNLFFPLIDYITTTGKPIIISSGLLNVKEISDLKKYIYSRWKSLDIHSQLAVLHCIVNYPATKQEANLVNIKKLHDILECTIGYSDHTLGIDASLVAAACGAKIIEKHFTIDKNLSDFHDHKISADPNEMRELVSKIKEVEILLGNDESKVQDSETKIEPLVRRSIVAERNLTKNDSISINDLTWVRPAGGIPPGSEHLIVGKTLNKNIDKGNLITLEDID